MEQARKILSVVAAAGVMLAATPSVLWAGSAAPDADPASFVGAELFDANASGTKFSGKLTIAYEVGDQTCDGATFYRNMYVVLVLEHGGQSMPFTSQYLDHATAGFCGLDGELLTQRRVIGDLLANKVSRAFCPECTEFKVKSISNFQYIQAGSAQLASRHVGGLSADITVALR
jgi:hypothetical protein